MSALKDFENSNAWNAEWKLPLVPQHDNPWIYLAYAVKIIASQKDPIKLTWFKSRVSNYHYACSGGWGYLRKRKPDGNSNPSHDELMGLSYLAWKLGLQRVMMDHLLYVLERDNWVYNPQQEEQPKRNFWIKRFIWMDGFMLACGERKVSLWKQFKFSLHLFLDAFLYNKGDEGGRLRNWLMLEPMEQFWLTRQAVRFWRWSMGKKGLSPRHCYGFYLAECPVFQLHAPGKF